MRISKFVTRAVGFPRPDGPAERGGVVSPSHFVTLRLLAADGTEGIGYAGFASTLLTRALKEVVDALAAHVVGRDPMDVEAIGAELLSLGGRGAPAGLVTRAASAIDVALWDLKGKALGQPVFKLLGGYRDRVPVYASGRLWRQHDLDSLAEAAHTLVRQGFRAMKLRLGGQDSVAAEVARLRCVREAVGPDVDVMVDVNQGWDVNRGVAVGRQLEEHDPFWLEDPVHHQDYAGLARIAQALDTPIATGEYHYGVAPFRHMLEQSSADIAMVDLMRVGGLTQWVKVAHLAEAFNTPVVSHLATETLAHAVAAVPNGLTIEHMPWSLPLFREAPRLEGGKLVLPTEPGLGVEFDDEALELHELS